MQLSRRLLSPVGDKEDTASLGPVALSILLGEIQSSSSEEAGERAEYLTVAYLALARVGGRDGKLRRMLLSDALSVLKHLCRHKRSRVATRYRLQDTFH